LGQETTSIRTKDGDCPAFVFTPKGVGPWPAVIFFMDGIAIRPTLFAMSARLAAEGYVVLLPDLYYRLGPYEPLDATTIFSSPEALAKLGPMMASTDNRRAAEDTAAYLAYLDARADVAGTKVGTTGYCMGGGISLTVAGTYPDRIAAAASFHGGNLATDSALSPHLLAPKMKGRIHVAGADADAFYPLDMHRRLKNALTDAGVDHVCEIYPGALHGWTMIDTPAYNEEAAERHWRELFALFAATLH